jgi:hypothetical protein
MKKDDAKTRVMSVNNESPVYSMGPDMGTELWFLWQFETRTLLHEHEVGPHLFLKQALILILTNPEKFSLFVAFLLSVSAFESF